MAAAVAVQRSLATHAWPEGAEVRVRIGIHTGEAAATDERYVGFSVHRAARVGGAAHGGQVLVSDATRVLVEDDLPDGVSLLDLGQVRLKDVDRPERLSQLVAAGLEERFRAPRTLDAGRRRLLRRRGVRVGLAAAALILAAAAAVGILLGSGSASAKTVRLVANSIAVIDARTGRPVGDVALGFTPTDVVGGGDRIWVLNEPGLTATAIDPITLRVVQTVGLDGHPASQFASGATDWVALPGAVEEIDTTGATKIALWSPSRIPGLARHGYSSCLAFVTGNASRVWVSEGRSFAKIDAASGSVLRTLTLPTAPGSLAGATCYGVRYTGGSLLAVRDPDESVGNLDPQTGAYTPIQSNLTGLSALSRGGGIVPWAAGFGTLWFSSKKEDVNTVRQQGDLTRLDLATGQLTSRTVIGADAGPLAIDPTSGAWVLDPTKETLVHVNPATGQVIGTISLHHFPCCPWTTISSGVAAGHGRIWVALQSP